MMRKSSLVLMAVMVGLLAMKGLAGAATPAEEAAKTPEKLASLLEEKSGDDASKIVADAVKAAIAMGGSERDIKKRLAALAAAAIPAGRDNAAAVAAALVRAGGDKYMALLVASVASAVNTLEKPPAVTQAAVTAAGANNADAAKDAAANPAQALGGLTARRVVRVAEFVQALVDGKKPIEPTESGGGLVVIRTIGGDAATGGSGTETIDPNKTRLEPTPPLVRRRRRRAPTTPDGKL
jgi:hypothetical protein